jgi:hypothetical protein
MLMTRHLTCGVLSLVLLCGAVTTLHGGQIPATCFANPLPSTPMAPVYTTLMGDLDAYMQVEVWRQPCTDSSGRIVPLMKITPKAAPPFVCSVEFSVIQAGIQYDVRLQTSSSGSSLCTTLFVPATVILGQFSTDPPFDDEQAFTLIFDDVHSDYVLNIGAAVKPPPPPAPPALALQLNQTVFTTGQILRVTLGLSNPGPLLTTDVYVGAIMPDGVNTLFLTNFSPLAGVATTLNSDPRTFAQLLRNVTWPAGLRATQPDYFTYTFTGLEPSGTYHFLVAWTKPDSLGDGRIDAGDVLALAWTPFVFTPGSPAGLYAKMQAIRARHMPPANPFLGNADEQLP